MILKSLSKLNRHTKIAIFVAPILVILGFAASDLWLENKAYEVRFFQMTPESGVCDILANQCVLVSGEFKISVYQENGLTTINSTFPLDTATLFLVDENDISSVFQMGMKDSPYYWYQTTPLEVLAKSPGSRQKLRLVATVKGGQYISEFYSVTSS
ncbi:MAG: Uncharacterised protein [Glaciecola sp. HTCC2999]|nr:MAG: Uncharacterised protein [Glaciecola sp. HTCC2999]